MSALVDRFFSIAAERADAPAISCDGATLTYSALASRVAHLSNGLAARGVAPGDAIAILAENSVEFVTLMLAAADLGAMLVPLSPSLPPEAIARAFAAADVRHVCADEECLGRLNAADVAVPGMTCAMRASAGMLSLDALIDSASPDAQQIRRGEDDSPFILCMTSGSTGAPKAIVLTQRAKLERARAAIALYGVTKADRILAATPLYHSLAERLAFTAFTSGAHLLLMRRYTPAQWLAGVENERATFTIAVSSQLSQIVRRLKSLPAPERKARCGSLRCVVSSSASLPAEDKALILSALPGAFHECYGASEIAIATSLNLTRKDAPLQSVGKPAPGVDIRILDDSGAPVPAGAIGEIACRTPMLFAGYHKRADLTAAAMTDGYFKTGDLGRVDDKGALYYVGRKKDLIISGGINVYPADVEAIVSGVAGVRECAAFAWPDEYLGEVVALAVAQSGPVSARELRRACAERLADFQHPRRIFFIEALPRNAMGKLMRQELLPLVTAVEARAA